mmetsp:Transcript_12292/g.36081  ORF Transcript_12292/g.36081 Transcript_12292/m.36081 type:complete len:314 (-) Transcript_12292:1800-2741(-)
MGLFTDSHRSSAARRAEVKSEISFDDRERSASSASSRSIWLHSRSNFISAVSSARLDMRSLAFRSFSSRTSALAFCSSSLLFSVPATAILSLVISALDEFLSADTALSSSAIRSLSLIAASSLVSSVELLAWSDECSSLASSNSALAFSYFSEILSCACGEFLLGGTDLSSSTSRSFSRVAASSWASSVARRTSRVDCPFLKVFSSALAFSDFSSATRSEEVNSIIISCESRHRAWSSSRSAASKLPDRESALLLFCLSFATISSSVDTSAREESHSLDVASSSPARRPFSHVAFSCACFWSCNSASSADRSS